MIFLMYNIGNSGGSWFEKICNSHPQVHAWEELTRILGNSPPLNEEEILRAEKTDTIAVSFLKEQLQKTEYKSVGLIKSFGQKTVEFCLQNNGAIVQMFRNPIKVVKNKMYSKRRECLIRGVFKEINTEKEEFEAHVEYYASLYLIFLRRAKKYPLIRLEDLNQSITNGTSYLQDVLQDTTGVAWSDQQIAFIKNNIYPTNKVGFDRDRDDEIAWNSWSDQEHGVFLKYFKDIMIEAGYSIL